MQVDFHITWSKLLLPEVQSGGGEDCGSHWKNIEEQNIRLERSSNRACDCHKEAFQPHPLALSSLHHIYCYTRPLPSHTTLTTFTLCHELSPVTSQTVSRSQTTSSKRRRHRRRRRCPGQSINLCSQRLYRLRRFEDQSLTLFIQTYPSSI